MASSDHPSDAASAELASRELQHDLERLAGTLRQLEVEYNLFFAGRKPRPPRERRAEVERLLRRWDRAHIDNAALRFRFRTMQARFATFADLWDRAMRAREEGRPGPLSPPRPGSPAGVREVGPQILHVASFADPLKELDKLHGLYEAVMDARRELGEGVVPFHRFTELVKEQVRALRSRGSPEVAFKVAIREGKVNLSARGLKGVRLRPEP